MYVNLISCVRRWYDDIVRSRTTVSSYAETSGLTRKRVFSKVLDTTDGYGLHPWPAAAGTVADWDDSEQTVTSTLTATIKDASSK